nr:MAG TPA: ASCH domain protein [Caudoviricetes sp.]
MAIKPILFNTEMVRAILDGRKSCTRRLVKNDVEAVLNSPYHKAHPEVEDKQIISKLCNPPYQPGDILYIRETWAWCPCWDCGLDVEEPGCGHEQEQKYNGEKKEHGCYIYRASCADNEYPSVDTWHPSIHMPKEVARIWLKVTDVRVERLQEITAEETKKEGCDGRCECPSSGADGSLSCKTRDFSLEKFETIWDSTVKKTDLDRYGWDANPWVWVIEFERCEKPAESPYAWNDAIHKLMKGV